MPLSWNEIKLRALAFTKEWKEDVSEDAEAKHHATGISKRTSGT